MDNRAKLQFVEDVKEAISLDEINEELILLMQNSVQKARSTTRRYRTYKLPHAQINTQDLLDVLSKFIERGKPHLAIVMSSSFWNEILTDHELFTQFTTNSNFDKLMEGHAGTFHNTMVFTDAYQDEQSKVLNYGELFVLGGAKAVEAKTLMSAIMVLGELPESGILRVLAGPCTWKGRLMYRLRGLLNV